jgi:hypothetical protein
MKRPTKLDWILYRIFRWWWNPILTKNIHLLIGLRTEIDKWLERNGHKQEEARHGSE